MVVDDGALADAGEVWGRVSLVAPEMGAVSAQRVHHDEDDVGCLGRRLEALALCQRQELDFEVTAITGSVGKTTTKEFLRDILGSECAVAAAPKSFNNRLGVALTLLEADEETRHLVVEMGTSGKGELSYLSNRVRPERILITTVTEAHIKGLGNLAGVIEAKAEILEGLAPGGQVYLNPATPGFGEFCSRLDRKPRTFGVPDADFPLELNPAAGAVDWEFVNCVLTSSTGGCSGKCPSHWLLPAVHW